MQENNYYTYKDIILGLRREYQKNQELLDELIKLIHIECKSDFSKDLYLSLNNYGFADLYLNVLKKQNMIKEMYDYIYHSFICYNDTKDLTIKKAVLKLEKNDGKLQFVDKFWLRESAKFKPKVEITNYKAFSEIYNELIRLPLFNSEQVLKSLNAFQVLNIQGTGINLRSNTRLDGKKNVSISYDSKTDQIKVERNCWDASDEYAMSQLLYTPIPRYLLPKSYCNILDKNKHDIDLLFFDLHECDVPSGNYEITSDKRLVKVRTDKKV